MHLFGLTGNRKTKISLLNDFLTILIILLALYVMLAPFLPQLTFWTKEHSPAKVWLSNSESVKIESNNISNDNKLYIPKIGLSEIVNEGGESELKNGVLRRGFTSTPDEGSNTVLVGHRFAYGARGVFYHLDKLKVGDEVTVHWQGDGYTYLVTDTFVATPDQVEVESATDSEVLTLYTCTPLWTVTDRLIVKAQLVEGPTQ